MNESQQYRDYQNRGGTLSIRDWRKRRLQFSQENSDALIWHRRHPEQPLTNAPNYQRVNALERELKL